MLKTGDRVYAFHEGSQKRARVVTVDESLGFATVSLKDKTEVLVSTSEVAPLYRWTEVEGGEAFTPLFEVNGFAPPVE